jgi:hypothetical protein
MQATSETRRDFIMKTTVCASIAAAFLANTALAAVRYVDVNSTNATPPYTSWASAATNIQDAVDAAVAGDEIVVTNGIYATGGRAVNGSTNRVTVDKSLTVRSVSGPQSTVIDGGGIFRCVYLTNEANLSGFTLTNGRAWYGAGLICESTNAVALNCVVSGNSTVGRPQPPCPGVGCDGPVLSSALSAAGDGGGAFGGTLNNCTLTGNSAFYGGGADECILNNCTLARNRSTGGLRNGVEFSPCGGGAFRCALNNCTLTGNSGGGAQDCKLNNCIVYFNINTGQQANYDYYFSILNYSCTTPLPTNGVGNITNEPAFVNPAAGNYRLPADSPCIDAGTNLSASITNDLDGRPRPLDGNGDGLAAFDMGAYEYRTPLLVWQGSPNPTPPHADWATAAHTIQDAVDVAVAGDEIVVTNGTYASGGRHGNRVEVNSPLTIRSANGPQFTIIDGGRSRSRLISVRKLEMAPVCFAYSSSPRTPATARPAASRFASLLFIHQQHVRTRRRRQSDGLGFAGVERGSCRQNRRRHRLHNQPAVFHRTLQTIPGCGMCQSRKFPRHSRRDADDSVPLLQKIEPADDGQVAEGRRVTDGAHGRRLPSLRSIRTGGECRVRPVERRRHNDPARPCGRLEPGKASRSHKIGRPVQSASDALARLGQQEGWREFHRQSGE